MVTPAECPAVQKAVDTVDVLQLSPEVYLRISSTYYSYKVRQGLTASLPPVREATTGWCPMCPVAGPTARKIMLSLTRSGVYLVLVDRGLTCQDLYSVQHTVTGAPWCVQTLTDPTY